MLKFTKSVPYIPDPARSRPHVTAEERALGAAQPPEPVPYHCKPWLDGQSLGWTLFYGYLTPVVIVGREGGRIEVENLEQLARETNQPRIIDQFAPDHFGIGSGYTLKTPPGILSLIVPPTDPPTHLQPVLGAIETDWYPRQIFLVFKSPAPGCRIELDHGRPLARVVLVPRHDSWTAEPFTTDELADSQAQEKVYLAEEQTSPTRWQAATGSWFTHLYKIWSQRYRKGEL